MDSVRGLNRFSVVVAFLVANPYVHGEVTEVFGSVGEFDDGYLLRVTDPAPIVEEPLIPLTEVSLAVELDVANGKMYYIDAELNAIRRTNLNGSSPETILSGFTELTAMCLDLANGKLYWGDSGLNEIQRSNLDGSSVETVANQSTGNVDDIAVDAINGKVYWVDDSLLIRANLDGSEVEGVDVGEFGGGGVVPSSVALDIAGGKAYWTHEPGGIRRVNFDKTSAEYIALAPDDSGLWPISIALDLSAGEVYWSNLTGGPIRKANLDGTHISIAYAPAEQASFFTLDTVNRTLYWSEGLFEGDSIVRAELPAITRLPQDLITGCGLALHNNQVYYIDANRNGAPTGIGSIHRANLDGSSDQTLLSSLNAPLSMAIDGVGGKLYWNDLFQGIWRANLNGSTPQLIVSTTGTAVYLDLDRVNNKVYWTEAATQSIRRANLDGTNTETVVPGINPRGIAIHNGLGKIYWTRWDASRGIFRANLNGTSIETIVGSENVDQPFALKIDEPSGTMYWTDFEGTGLRRANIDGSNIEDVYSAEFPVLDIALRTQASAEVWVDFAATGPEIGTEANPFNSVQEGLVAVLSGGTIYFAGDSTDTSSNETLTVNQPITLEAVGGSVTIGNLGGRIPSARVGFIAPENN